MEQLIQRISRYNREKSKIYVVPELSLVFKWTYEEASLLGVQGFANNLLEKLNIALSKMKLR